MSAPANSSVADALDAVHRQPRLALAIADDVLARPGLDQRDRAAAQWAHGMARRELDDLSGADEELGAARATALAAGDPQLAARIDVSRSLVRAYLGRGEEGLALLDAVAADLSGADLAHLEMQRGLIEHRRGRLEDARRHYLLALPVMERERDVVGLARLEVNLGALYVYVGELDAAADHCRRGADVASVAGLDLLAAGALHNLGYALSKRGDVVAALESLDRAQQIYDSLAETPNVAALRMDRAGVFREANLLSEAKSEADAALVASRARGHDTEHADAALLASRCRLAADDRDGARSAAAEAAALYRAQGRDEWLPVAELVRLLAREPAGDERSLAVSASRLAATLRSLRWRREASEAGLMAASAFARSGDVARAERELRLMPSGADASPTQAAALCLARARVHAAAGRRAAARRSLTAGISVLRQNERSVGATELRAHYVDHAKGLRQLGLELAVEDGRAREFLVRSESALGLTNLVPQARQAHDPELGSLLTELRSITDAEGREPGRDAGGVSLARRRQLEAAIRHRTRLARGAGERAAATLHQALEALDDRMLLEFAVIDGRLWAASVVRGRARLHELGTAGSIRDEIDALAFAIDRLQRRELSEASRAAAIDVVRTTARRLDDLLVPTCVRRGSAPLIVVPADRLHGLPWATLPTLRGRPVTIAPSLLDWHQAASVPRSGGPARALLVAGPDLELAATEVESAARSWQEPVRLVAAAASADRCLAALQHSELAHFACHGSFRADNPMFSSLRVHDGDLNVYDLESCASLPRTIVLSSCNAARSRVLEGGAVLGMASALLQLGVSSVVAPLTTVNDERSVDLMLRLHAELGRGAEACDALAAAAVGPDGEVDAAAASFVCIGR